MEARAADRRPARCLVVAGTSSGVGKTSISLGLAWALRRRGLAVQSFKVGPDFLDPTYLARATGRPCYNLDGWMCGRGYVASLFARKTAEADFALVEGVMGLFDGAGPASSAGSSAEIARWLDAPVLLVVESRGMARSLAALVAGFASFEPGVRIAGVVANGCGSPRHAALLSEALAARDLPPLLGGIGQGALPTLQSRHLGLTSADRENLADPVLDRLADAVAGAIPLERLLALAGEARCAPVTEDAQDRRSASRARVRIGIARDEAFHFYYPDNLEALEDAGARLVPFSPLRDARLPDDLDGLYLGGGYPEEHAQALADNASMRQAVREYAATGRPVYAECGGLMYLSREVVLPDGARRPMAGVLPAATRMHKRLSALGYVEVDALGGALFGRPGERLRGHEFHYSELVEAEPAERAGWESAWTLEKPGHPPRAEGFARGQILASYVHLHFASRPGAAGHLVEACRRTP